MSASSRHDAWQAGDSYEAYMGRWSRLIAPQFLDRLKIAPGLDWLEVGCGTGVLSSAIVARCAPANLIAIDPSTGFLASARAAVPDPRVEFRQGDAQSLAIDTASRDAVVSGLVLNFVPDREKAIAEMRRVARPNGSIAFYVWDYPGGGMEIMRTFWTAATALDAKARDLTEDKRFPFCTRDGLIDLAGRSGLSEIACSAIEVPTVLKDFDDYWRPFTLGAGPAPGYCMRLDENAREKLKEKLSASLPRQSDGTIALKARAWMIKAKPR
jgi:SAM-dependent methyltransferase